MGVYSIKKQSIVNEKYTIKYTEIKTTKEVIDNYKPQYPRLMHVKCNEQYQGILLNDNKKFVAIIQWDINSKYIVALEVAPEYRKQGIAEYLLQKSYSKGINKLSVNKANKSAIKLYLKNGYKEERDDTTMIYMIKESSIIDKANEWEKDANSELVGDDSNNLSELELEKNKYDMMHHKQKRVADWQSEDLFGKTNTERYNDLKGEYIKDIDNFDAEYNSTWIASESSVSSNGEYDITEDDEYNKLKDDPNNETPDYDSPALKEAISWCNNTMLTIILPVKSLQELEDSLIKWRSMTRKHQRDSDNKSLELFQLNNMEHYDYLKTKFIGSRDPDDSYDTTTVLDVSDKADEIEKIEDELSVAEESGKVSKLDYGISLLKLNNIKTNDICSSIIKNKAISSITQKIENIYDESYDMIPAQLPYFSFNEIKSKTEGLDISSYEGLSSKLNLKGWLDSYSLLCNGIVDSNMGSYIPLWISSVNELCIKLSKEKDENIKAHLKENILLLGWNPEIYFTNENRIKASRRCLSIISEYYKDNSINLESLISNASTDNEISITEQTKKDQLHPIYILLTYTGTTMGKMIKKYTSSIYSHAALSLDSSLERLYSFNADVDGFSLESISRYLKNSNNGIMKLSCIFVKTSDLNIIQSKLNDLLLNIKNTSYSFLNLLGIALNRSIQMNYSMICSEFVDYILKSINVDITNKDSGLVSPKDFQIVKNKRVYTLYEGKMSEYNIKKINTVMNVLINKAAYIKENFSIENKSQFINIISENASDINNIMQLDSEYNILESNDIFNESDRLIYNKYIKTSIDIINEAKEFPVQFDNDGNLLIKNKKQLDFEVEYAKAHKLLKVYDDTNNIEGMKYEVSKLWFLNLLLEDGLYTKKINNNDHLKVRARVLNDFTKYIKIISNNDNNFNFTEYYNNTPFSDETTKINKSTLKYSGELLKSILKHILH